MILSILIFNVWATPTLKNMKKEHRVAIVVGNNNYDDHALDVSHTNARNMKKFLEKNGFYVYYGENLDKKNFVRLLRKFYKNLHANGIGLFYYSGHAVQTRGKNYLVTVDNGILDESMIVRKSISLNTVYNSMADSYNRLNIVILDTAFEKPFGELFTPKKKGLAPFNTSKAHVTFSAVKPHQQNTSDSFTKDFLSLAQHKGLELTPLKKRLQTLRRQHRQPAPHIIIARNQPFYFVLPNHIPAPDELAYSKLRENGGQTDLENFINKYPKSTFVPAAKAQLKKIYAKKEQQRKMQQRIEFEKQAAEATKRAKTQAALEAKKKNEINFKLTKPEEIKKRTVKKPKQGEERQIILE